MENKKKTTPFNNEVETGLRILCLLNEAYPRSFDVQFLVYLDYLTVHSADVDFKEKSLHPAVPYRTGELFVRSSLIQSGLDLFISKNFVERLFVKEGIEYIATEGATPFIEVLEENYTLKLIEKAKWVIKNYGSFNLREIKEFIERKTESLNKEFNVEILE